MNRLMIAASSSGSGKTLITCALIKALKDRGINLRSYKCGPDYIDPMFHRRVLGIEAGNLDTYFSDSDTIIHTIVTDSHELAIIEGVMGLYDGLGGTEAVGSSYDLACVTRTPIILVVDVHGMGRTMISVIRGILSDDTEHLIKGIILNRISEGFYNTMKPLIEADTEVKVLGFFKNNKDLKLESRHLGLVQPDELDNIDEMLSVAADTLISGVDVDAIVEIAKSAEELIDSVNRVDSLNEPASVRLAVARDEAFSFYYEENLKMFEEAGVEIVEFSPIHDTSLPENISGILLGGGYPENYLKELSVNSDMLNALKVVISERNIPTLAECGGFMYLHEEVKDESGINYPLVGVISGISWKEDHLVRFGYAEVVEKVSTFLPAEEVIKGHEFHYYDTSENGDACVLRKPTTGKTWYACIENENQFMGFVHLYYPSNPKFVSYFADRMKEYQQKNYFQS